MAKKKPTARPALSPAKRGLFTGITILLPIVLLAAAELTLRVFGWGGYPAWIREAGELSSGATLRLVEPAAAKPYFFANPTRPGYADQTNFLMPKPADTIRIFVIGESAAKGYPQPRNLALSSFLQAMLADAWPDKKVEVINLGTTAVASFPLVYQVRDALESSTNSSAPTARPRSMPPARSRPGPCAGCALPADLPSSKSSTAGSTRGPMKTRVSWRK
jgi:hypothetical protein